MKNYIAPEVDIYKFRLTEDVLADTDGSKQYGGDEIIGEEVTDPFA